MAAAVRHRCLSVEVGALYSRGRPRLRAPLVLCGVDLLGEVTLELEAELDRLHFSGRRVDELGDSSVFSGSVGVGWEPANLGGERPLLRCSFPLCRRRVRRIFLAGERLLCRQCAGVEYASRDKRVTPQARRLARISVIRERLGGQPDWDVPFPERPKGMHLLTYDRLCLELADLAELERAWHDQVLRSPWLIATEGNLGEWLLGLIGERQRKRELAARLEGRASPSAVE